MDALGIKSILLSPLSFKPRPIIRSPHGVRGQKFTLVHTTLRQAARRAKGTKGTESARVIRRPRGGEASHSLAQLGRPPPRRESRPRLFLSATCSTGFPYCAGVRAFVRAPATRASVSFIIRIIYRRLGNVAAAAVAAATARAFERVGERRERAPGDDGPNRTR